ncbi:collagen alpha-3(VI) chain-like [Liolophura sinensis]|uniref:collagen alpha-3(VI) chain-like n=1 Tax=Liolophura sinensis TaxID=3198878 RepID=UPI0031594346
MDFIQLLLSVTFLSSHMIYGGSQIIPDFSSQCFATGEVLFMVDGSDSILDVDFQRQKDLVLSIANSLYLSKVNGMRVGCIAFSTEIHGVPLTHSSRAHLFERAVDLLPHDRDGTETHSGIQYARTIFKEEARPNVPKILVILTDGFSQKPSLTISESARAKEENITIVTVGIGRQNQGIAVEAMDELVTIASYPDLTFNITGFDTLLSWAPNITQTVCELASTETVPLFSDDFFCPNVGEIIFMVDGSDSMLDINFAQEKNFVLSVVDSLYLDPVNGIRVGGLAFSTRVQGIPLDPFQNVSQFRESFGGLIHDQESTFTHLGIEYARGIFKSQSREGVPKTLVILTDGFSRRPEMTSQQAEDAKLEDVTIVVVGIGRAILGTNSRSRGELENIASSTDLLYVLPDFESLDPLVNNFTQTLCDFASLPGEIAPLPTTPLRPVTVASVPETTVPSAFIVRPDPRLPIPGTLTDCIYPAELMFMVDGSDSMVDINFEQEKDFVLSIVDSLYLNPADGIRVGGLAFSSRVQGIPLRPFLNVSEFRREFGRLVHDQESTFTHLGIQYAREVFRQQARQGVPRVLIILTDGLSRRPELTEQEAALAKQEGITVITVGIGSGNRDVGERAIQELEKMASSTDFVYLIQDFNELPFIFSNVTSTFCEVAAKSPLLPPPLQLPTRRIPPPTVATPPLTAAPSPPSITSTFSPARIPPAPEPGCRYPAELMFMVDGSDSMVDINFEQEKDFVLSIVDSLYLNPADGIRVGGLAFSSRVQGIPLRPFLNVSEFRREFGRLVHDQESTFTHLGIQYAREVFRQQARQGVPRVLIILTDGLSRRPELTEQEAALAKQEGITVITVGIGSGNRDVGERAIQELEKMASSTDFVYLIQDFNELPFIFSNVTSTFCEVAAKSSLLPPPLQLPTRRISPPTVATPPLTAAPSPPSITSTFSPARIPPAPEPGCRYPAELMFMVDGSDSMVDINFEQEKDFVLSIVDSLYLNPADGIRVGGLAFSSRVQGIPLRPFLNVSEFRREFGRLVHDQESTFTHLGIQYAREVFRQQARQGVPRVLIILTDGLSRRPELTEQEAALAKQEGITVITVGIGSGNRDVGERAIQELERIASSTDFVYLIQDFNELPFIFSNVTSTFCEVAAKSSLLPPPLQLPTRRISPPTVATPPLTAAPSPPSITSTFSPARIPPAPEPGCRYPAELMFMVDGSDSMVDINFEQEKEFVLSIVDSLYLNPADGIRVGGLAFSSRVQGIPLRPFLNVSEFRREFGRLVHDQESTFTHLGMQYAREVFRQQARQGVPRILIILTDGLSRRPELTEQEAALAKQEGITVITVGIGSGNRDAVERAIQELERIASSTDFVSCSQVILASTTTSTTNKKNPSTHSSHSTTYSSPFTTLHY